MTGTPSTHPGGSAKGAAVHSTLEFVRAQHGEVAATKVLGALMSDVRARIESVAPTAEIPYPDLVALWTAIDAELAGVAPTWIERSGAFSIESRGAQLYGGILRKSSPTEFLTQSVSLFRLFYHPGDMVVVDESDGRAVLRLVDFEAVTPLFCRRQAGGLTQALEIAGGAHPSTRHVRCVCEGDLFCEWEMTWSSSTDPERRDTPSRGLKLAG